MGLPRHEVFDVAAPTRCRLALTGLGIDPLRRRADMARDFGGRPIPFRPLHGLHSHDETQ
jgi:hypothetical protein